MGLSHSNGVSMGDILPGIQGSISPVGAGIDFQTTKSLLLNGTDEYVNIPVAASIGSGITTTMTCACWFKSINGFPATTEGLFSHSDSVTSDRKWLFEIFDVSSQRRLVSGSSNAGSAFNNIQQASVGPSVEGPWRFGAMVFDGALAQDDELKKYLDGTLQADSNIVGGSSNTLFNSTIDLMIGAINPATPIRFLNGNITDISLFDIALSNAEISEMYNSGVPNNLENHSQAGNLVGYWRPELSSTQLIDVISGNNGVFNNMDGTNVVTDAP